MAFGGLDIGTSGCKCTLFSDSGKQLTVSYRAYKSNLSAGKHEIDVSVIWDAVKTVLSEASRNTKELVEAISVSSFGESCALLDRKDRVIAPTMLYTDPRGTDEAERLTKKLGALKIYGISGHRTSATYTLPKLMWLNKHLLDKMSRIDKILPIASYVIYCLTGERISDPSLASRTMMLDVRTLRWNSELLSGAKIDENVLPEIVEIGTAAGTIRKTIAEELGLPSSLKIVTGAHDQVVAAIGAGALSPGSAVNSSGTVECITPVFSRVPNTRKLYNGYFAIVPMLKGRYVTYATTFSGGALLQWFRDNFAEKQATVAEKQGVSISDYLDSVGEEGPTGIMALPYFSGSATPYYDPTSKGAILGLTLEHTNGDIYRALQEGICYESALHLELLARSGIKISNLRIVGGGGKSRRWNQMKADIYGIPCTTLQNEEAGATGSAMLAGVALGKFDNLEQAAKKLVKEAETFLPRKKYTEQYTSYFKRYKKVYKAIRNI